MWLKKLSIAPITMQVTTGMAPTAALAVPTDKTLAKPDFR